MGLFSNMFNVWSVSPHLVARRSVSNVSGSQRTRKFPAIFVKGTSFFYVLVWDAARWRPTKWYADFNCSMDNNILLLMTQLNRHIIKLSICFVTHYYIWDVMWELSRSFPTRNIVLDIALHAGIQYDNCSSLRVILRHCLLRAVEVDIYITAVLLTHRYFV